MMPHVNPSTMSALRRLNIPRGTAPMRRHNAHVMPSPAYGASGPWLRIKQDRRWTVVQLTLLEAPGTYRTHTVRVDNNMIKAWLLKHGVRVGELEIGFSLGGLWKGIKKVAKKVGITKVLSVAAKVGKSIISNPIVNTLLPVTAIANTALNVTSGLVSAAAHLVKAKKSGDKKGIKKAKALLRAAKKAAKKGHPVAQTALAQTARIYKLAISPM